MLGKSGLARSNPSSRVGLLALIATLLVGGCAGRWSNEPPSRERLITAHLEGRYETVLEWCPTYLADALNQPRLSDWCLYGLPAAMWLADDSEHALTFVRVVCTDIPTGRLRGDDEFRTHYASEVVRWVAMSLRAQDHEPRLVALRPAMIEQISETCGTNPRMLARAADADTIDAASARAR